MPTAADVFSGPARWGVDCSDALAWLRSLPARSASLVFTSPPYEDQRTYGTGFKLRGQAWVDWLRPIVAAAADVSAGLVVVNAAGPVRGGSYSTSVEWLVADLTRLDGLVCGPAPFCWWKVCGVPGSGSKTYQRRDWEPLYAFCRPDRLPVAWTDQTAFGKPPRAKPGGEFSNRGRGGRRTKRMKGVNHETGSTLEVQHYAPPEIANPGNLIRARVGGGHLGHPLAHESEAPMPLSLAERFVCWYAAPDSVVCDPFAGSGTTCHAAVLHGRRFVGCDERQPQVDLVARRMATVTPSLLVPARA